MQKISSLYVHETVPCYPTENRKKKFNCECNIFEIKLYLLKQILKIYQENNKK